MFDILQSAINVSGLSLYDLVTSTASNSRHEVIATELQKTAAGALSFMLGRDAYDRPIVKHVERGAAVNKGDRQLSLNSFYLDVIYTYFTYIVSKCIDADQGNFVRCCL